MARKYLNPITDKMGCEDGSAPIGFVTVQDVFSDGDQPEIPLKLEMAEGAFCVHLPNGQIVQFMAIEGDIRVMVQALGHKTVAKVDERRVGFELASVAEFDC